MLAPGKYVVTASSGGQIFQNKFEIKDGDNISVEVLMASVNGGRGATRFERRNDDRADLGRHAVRISEIRKDPIGRTAVFTHALFDAVVLLGIAALEKGRSRQLPLLAGARQVAGHVGRLSQRETCCAVCGRRTVKRAISRSRAQGRHSRVDVALLLVATREIEIEARKRSFLTVRDCDFDFLADRVNALDARRAARFGGQVSRRRGW